MAGKCHPTAAVSHAVEGGSRGSKFWDQAVGESPRARVLIDGAEFEAVVDTGSQVSLLSRDLYEERLRPVCGTMETGHQLLKLTAANGTTLPYIGYIVASPTVNGVKIGEKVFFIMERTGPPLCLLGMNVLQDLEPFISRTTTDSTHRARSLRTTTVIPALSRSTLQVTGCRQSNTASVLFEPSDVSPRAGLLFLPSFGNPVDGKLSIPVINMLEEDVCLPGRTPLGTLSQACTSDQAVTMHVEATPPQTGETPEIPLSPGAAAPTNPLPSEPPEDDPLLSLHLNPSLPLMNETSW